MTYRAEIPYGACWSTPFSPPAGNVRASAFARIRGLHNPTQASLELGIDGEAIGHGVLGFSVLQAHSCYGLPWVAARAVIELVEELVQRGGGFGLFAGCAAGDSAMAVVVEVLDRRRS